VFLYLQQPTSFSFVFHIFFVVIKIATLLAAIAYYTLAERKIMAAVQRRRGPNVVGFWGLLQPLADGLKLFVKEMIIPNHANSRIFLFAPIIILMLSLLGWGVIPFYLYEPLVINYAEKLIVTELFIEADMLSFTLDGVSAIRYSVLFLLALSSLNVYGIIIAG